ncbi:MAG: AAA family ATPase [Candidatus Hodarchaeota archaeon]
MNNKNFLICLVGLPASGKSTFAKLLKFAIEKKYNNSKVRIIDPDIIRLNLTANKFDYKKEHIIRKENLKKIKTELEKGYIVISDDLNYYSSMRHDLKDIADTLGIDFFIIHIATPIEICMNWNVKRGEPIPNMVIKRIYERFDNFNRYKWDVADAIYDLSQMIELNPFVEDFLEKVLVKEYDKKCEIKSIEMKKRTSNLDNENLDKITRIYVGRLLHQSSYLPLKKRIIKLRKIFVKQNKNRTFSELEISKSFRFFLEKNLNVEINEDL